MVQTPDPTIAYWLPLQPTEPETTTPSAPAAEPRPQVRSHRWRPVLGAIACVAAAALPGAGGPVGTTLASPSAMGAGSVVDVGEGWAPLTEGEWIHIVGSGVSEPLPPGWAVLSLAPDALPTEWIGIPGALRWAGLDPEALLRRVTAPRRPMAGLLTGAWGEEEGGPDLSTSTVPVDISLPPVLDGFSHHRGPSAWVEGINYSDPAGVGLPLLQARGAEALRVSQHFQVRDFATRDGAPYLRVAPDLVAGLERMRSLLGPITVISGYRHPQYNALPSVGGARYSRHQSGQAADIWSGTASTQSMAVAAIQAMGCGIGLGLGRTTIHVDVRGYLSTWTYPGAPLAEATFDRWILAICGGAAVPPPAPDRRSMGAPWHALGPPGSEDEQEVVHLDDGTPEALESGAGLGPAEAEGGEAGAAHAVTASNVEHLVRGGLSDIARAAHLRHGSGVVVVDLAAGAPITHATLAAGARYVPARDREVGALEVGSLLSWVQDHPEGTHFAYVIRRGGARIAAGIAPMSRPPGEWLVIVASERDLSGAETALARYGRALRTVGLGTVLHVSDGAEGRRYNVVVGPFHAEADAQRVAEQAAAVLPERARVVHMD